MIKKIVGSFSVKLISAILNFASIIILSRVLGPAGKGEASLILTDIAFVLLLCNLINGASLVFLVPKFNIRTVVAASTIWTVIVTALIYFLFFSNIITVSYLPHVLMLSVINSLAAVNMAILLGKERIKIYNLISLMQVILFFSLLCYFLLIDHSPSIDGYLYSLYVSYGLQLVLSGSFILHFLSDKRPLQFKKFIADSFRYGTLNQLAHITQFLTFRFCYYLLELWYGDAVVGVYSTGISVAESVWLVGMSISTVQYSKIVNITDKKESGILSLHLLKVAFVLTSLALLIQIFLPVSFYTSIFGDDFAGIKDVIQYNAIGILSFSVVLIISHYFSGNGNYHINAISSALGLIPTLIVAPFLIKSFGMAGAGIAGSIANLITMCYVIYKFVNEQQYSWKDLIITKSDFGFFSNKLGRIFSK